MGLAAASPHRVWLQATARQKSAQANTGDPAFGYPAKGQRELAAVVAG